MVMAADAHRGPMTLSRIAVAGPAGRHGGGVVRGAAAPAATPAFNGTRAWRTSASWSRSGRASPDSPARSTDARLHQGAAGGRRPDAVRAGVRRADAARHASTWSTCCASPHPRREAPSQPGSGSSSPATTTPSCSRVPVRRRQRRRIERGVPDRAGARAEARTQCRCTSSCCSSTARKRSANGRAPTTPTAAATTSQAAKQGRHAQDHRARFILVDMIGDRDLRIMPRGELDAVADRRHLGRRRQARAAASSSTRSTPIEDDHLEFLAAGVPSVDIIDLDYPAWHRAEDTLDKLSASVAAEPSATSSSRRSPDIEARAASDRVRIQNEDVRIQNSRLGLLISAHAGSRLPAAPTRTPSPSRRSDRRASSVTG